MSQNKEETVKMLADSLASQTLQTSSGTAENETKLTKSEAIIKVDANHTLKSEYAQNEEFIKRETLQKVIDGTPEIPSEEKCRETGEVIHKSENVVDAKDKSVTHVEQKCEEIGEESEEKKMKSDSEPIKIEPVSTLIPAVDGSGIRTELDKQLFHPTDGLDDQTIMRAPFRYIFKVIMAGDPNVGKSSIIERFVYGSFGKCEPTVGVDFHIKLVMLDNRTAVRVHIFDLAGSERLSILSRAYFRRSDGALFVYDESDLSSLDCITAWREEMDRYVHLSNGKPIPSILLGNKCDQETEEHVKQRAEIKKLAKKTGMRMVINTSAKEDIGIQTAFRHLIDMMIDVTKLKKDGELESSFVVEGRILDKEFGVKKCAC